MSNRWFISGDTHRKYTIARFNQVPDGANCIILGDAGINYSLDEQDLQLKKKIAALDRTYYLVRGNHEERPENIATMRWDFDPKVQGEVYLEDAYPNIRYFKDGGEYNINGYSVLVIGGAYSVDKYWRLEGLPEDTNVWTGWFKDEQLSKSEMERIYNQTKGKRYDYVLTHTCPISWRPIDLFLTSINQSTVDTSMELFLQGIEYNIQYKSWYWGHYHADRTTFISETAQTRKMLFGAVEEVFMEVE